MKKLILLSTLLIATICMLAFNLLPHHHHGKVACLVTEDMHDSSEATDNNCLYDYDTAKRFVVNKEVKQLASYRFINQFLPLFAVIANELLLKQADTPAYAFFDAPANLYRPALLCADNGLRAPPTA